MESTVKIFAVEDDPTYGKFLEYVLSLNPDYDVELFTSGGDCINNLHLKPNIIALDYTLPDMSGEEVLKKVKNFNSAIQIIIVSAQEKIGTAVRLLKLGAYDYIIKNEDTKDRLLNSINNARKNISLTEEIHSLRTELSEKYEFEKSIIGKSKAIKNVFSMLEKAINTNIIVSITGETGTGKELIAKTIHYNSMRKKEPFVTINIAAIPKELIESELFGHEKGSFTGAVTRRIGKFEEAQGGTIFLDEIGEMDMNLQAKLLRVIQEKEVTRIGSNKTIKLDVRVLVATHRNLVEEVKNGNFREDLYYRLLGLPVLLPPLRERDNDVVIIAKYFLKEFCKENGIHLLKFSSEAQDKLLKYQYPGNVRELKSIVDLAAVLADGDEIEVEDIKFSSILDEDKLTLEELTLKEYSFKIITHMLEKYDNNVIKVAKKLDIGKSTIYRYLKEMEDLKDQ
ncbi:MAG: sigma-54-dependent Fis family transcriptional regulator [Cyclobacteriaceae bacterium]|nr:sigma-54-dependent Fis family transcriptional regulator [Cyclobacteriaceae bacterium]MCK5370559.1 sigma-54-dependent Fis family transcriptional regulator [Cyclobacteriaceae bacterium]